MLLNKQVINLNLIKSNSKVFKFFRELKSFIYVDDYENLKKYVIDILEDNSFGNELFNNEDEFYEKWNKFNDGKSSYRIFDLMTKSK
jgi:hypothetical protein